MAFTEDLTVFFNTDDFAVVVTKVDETTFDAIFDNAEYQVQDGDQVVSMRQPELLCRESDVSSLSQGDTLTVNGTNYTLAKPEPDGTGIIRLVLRST